MRSTLTFFSYYNAGELLPSQYYIRPTNSLNDTNCFYLPIFDGYHTCSSGSLLLDSIHGPHSFKGPHWNPAWHFVGVKNNDLVVFNFNPPVDIVTIQIYYLVASSSANYVPFRRSRITVYTVANDGYTPNYPLPESAQQIRVVDVHPDPPRVFQQTCINASLTGVKNLVLAVTLKDRNIVFSEVNFFGGTFPHPECEQGIFSTFPPPGFTNPITAIPSTIPTPRSTIPVPRSTPPVPRSTPPVPRSTSPVPRSTTVTRSVAASNAITSIFPSPTSPITSKILTIPSVRATS